jgi:TonB family protein
MVTRKQIGQINLLKYRLLVPAIVAIFVFSSNLTSLAQTKIIDHVETMPTFPGGYQALYKYVEENLQYSKELAESCLQGRTIVRFVIAVDGSIEDIKVLRALYPSCDEEVVRIIQTMPKWIPAQQQKGTLVASTFTISITFKLQDKSKKFK